jgi:hypothetical protein
MPPNTIMLPLEQTKTEDEEKKKRLSTFIPVCPSTMLPFKLRGVLDD